MTELRDGFFYHPAGNSPEQQMHRRLQSAGEILLASGWIVLSSNDELEISGRLGRLRERMKSA